MANTNNNYRFETLQLHVGQEQPDPATDSRAVPIYQTTSYVFRDCAHAAARFNLSDAGNIYGRLTNSTQDVFEKRIAALEGGVAGLAVASGAAAITYTIKALAQEGDHIVAQKTIYGGSYNLLAHTLPLYGIKTTFVDAHNLEEIENAIQENTKAIYLETLGNPNCDIPDLDAISELAHKHGLPVVVDNTFGTPYLIRPIEHGVDIVVHSATKFIGGHGTTLGGVIVDSGKFDWKKSGKYAPIAEPNPSYHGISFADAVGPAAFVTYIRAILLRDEGAMYLPIQRLPAAARYRDSVPPLRASCREHQEGNRVLGKPSKGCKGKPPIPAGASGPRSLREVLPERWRFHLHLRDQGRSGRSTPLHRQFGNLLSAGKRCRRKISGCTSGYHNPLSAERRGTGRSGHYTGYHSPVHRYRAY